MGAFGSIPSRRIPTKRDANRPGAVELPSLGVRARCSEKATNGTTTEVWQRFRRSTELLLGFFEQATQHLAIVDLDDVAGEALISVTSSRDGGVAAGDGEQNLLLAASSAAEGERTRQEGVLCCFRGAVERLRIERRLEVLGCPGHHLPSFKVFRVSSMAASRLRIASRVISPRGRVVVVFANS